VTLATAAWAWDDRYEITPDRFNDSPWGKGIEMRKQYGGYDSSTTYQGTIDRWGDVELRNRDGDRVRGNIDKFGGTLRDQNGNTWRVDPRW
jgi:hypothetical protein